MPFLQSDYGFSSHQNVSSCKQPQLSLEKQGNKDFRRELKRNPKREKYARRGLDHCVLCALKLNVKKNDGALSGALVDELEFLIESWSHLSEGMRQKIIDSVEQNKKQNHS